MVIRLAKLTNIIPTSSTLLSTTSSQSSPYIPANLLSILERLINFPTLPPASKSKSASGPEKAGEAKWEWLVPELGVKPKPRAKDSKSNLSPSSDDESDLDDTRDDDDWRKFFEEPVDKEKDKPSGVKGRVHTLTLHESLHSLSSHRAVFTRAWLSLLPRLNEADSKSIKSIDGTKPNIKQRKELSLRALNVMHHSVLPYLTRAVLVMDWVAGGVEEGKLSVVTHFFVEF